VSAHLAAVSQTVAQHIAGLPVEEVLLAALAAATPMLALIGWEIRDRVRRLRARLSDRTADAVPENGNAVPETTPEVP
jgi:hypothetical protein